MSTLSNKITYQIVGDDKQLMQDLDRAEKGIESRSGGFMSSAKKIGAAIGGALATKQIVEWGSSFESSMAAASTLFGDVQVNAEGLNKDLLALSDSTGIAADRLGNSLYNALSAGVPASEDMGEALAFLESSSKLAAAGFTDIDTAQSATIKTLNAYKMDISEADKIQKILIQTQNKGIVTVGELGNVLAQVTPTAAAMNVSFEQVGAGIANMTAQGTPAAQATTQLNALFAELGKSGTQAQKNLMAAAEGTKYAGKSFQDLMAEGVPLNEVLDLMNDYAQENNLSMLDMFSSIEAGKGALSNSGQNAQAFTEALEAMGTETDVVGEAFDKVSDTSAFKFNEVMNQLKNIAIDLFIQFAPFITEMLPILGEMLQMILPPLMEIVKALLPPLLEIFKALLPPLSTIIGSLMPVVIEIFNAFIPVVEAVLTVLQWLIDFVVGVFTGQWSDSWKEVGAFFTEIWEKLTRFITDTWNSIKDLAIRVWDAISSFFSDTWNGIKDLVIRVWDAISSFFSDTWNGIKNTATSVFNALAGFFSGIWSGISGTFSTYIGMIKGFFTGLWSSISDVVGGIKRVFSGLIDFFTGVFTGNWRQALDGIKDIFGGAFDALIGIAKAPINAVVGVINGFIAGLNKIKIPSWVPGVGGKGINIPKLNYLKVGLQYVPDDDFPAMLHEGEAVLTKEQADRWRKGLPRFENYHQYDFAGSSNITLKNEMVGIVEMDGYNVGKIVLRNIDEVREMG